VRVPAEGLCKKRRPFRSLTNASSRGWRGARLRLVVWTPRGYVGQAALERA
jgi:hypothetical protein